MSWRSKPVKSVLRGNLLWSEFREQYSTLKQFRSDDARASAEVRLDICERLVGPKRISDMADPTVLVRLQAQLLTTRSEHTVISYLQSLIAALNWAHGMGWLPDRVKYEALRTGTLETHKGRPITRGEFDAMLEACEKVCARGNPASWKFLLRGLWHSGLRLGEAFNLTWDTPGTLRPLRHLSGHIILEIPASDHKNKRDQTIPTIPEFAQLLDEIPVDARTGRVFNPEKLRGQGGYSGHKQIGRVITEIGRAAGVYVNDTKPASAHDLRRSFGQRLADAGVPARDLQAIMRHKHFSATERYYLTHRAADQAERIANVLNQKVGYADVHRTQQAAGTATTDESP